MSTFSASNMVVQGPIYVFNNYICLIETMSSELIYKQFASFIANGINSIISVIKILVKSNFRTKLPASKGESCIVLANGPSLNQSMQLYPKAFEKTPLMCLNSFAMTEEFERYKPCYYVLLDPFFWDGKNTATINTFKGLEEKTTWKLYLFVPQYALNKQVFLDLKKKNSFIEILPYNYTVFKGFDSIAHWFYSKNLAMPQSLSVTVPSLFLSINMGYKEVYLVGADHSWHENLYMSEDNVLHTVVPHFYDGKPVSKTPMYKPFSQLTRKAHEFFEIWSRTFFGYILVNDYAVKRGCKIYNASEISFVDAFERKKLQTENS